ncbi:hypothetical protein D3C79_1056900 [compost metagenome]
MIKYIGFGFLGRHKSDFLNELVWRITLRNISEMCHVIFCHVLLLALHLGHNEINLILQLLLRWQRFKPI